MFSTRPGRVQGEPHGPGVCADQAPRLLCLDRATLLRRPDPRTIDPPQIADLAWWNLVGATGFGPEQRSPWTPLSGLLAFLGPSPRGRSLSRRPSAAAPPRPRRPPRSAARGRGTTPAPPPRARRAPATRPASASGRRARRAAPFRAPPRPPRRSGAP